MPTSSSKHQLGKTKARKQAGPVQADTDPLRDPLAGASLTDPLDAPDQKETVNRFGAVVKNTPLGPISFEMERQPWLADDHPTQDPDIIDDMIEIHSEFDRTFREQFAELKKDIINSRDRTRIPELAALQEKKREAFIEQCKLLELRNHIQKYRVP